MKLNFRAASDTLDRAIQAQLPNRPPTLKSKGWHNESARHSLAAKGVETSIPFDSRDIQEMNIEDRRALREAISSELEAISMYEKIAQETDDPRIRKIFDHIAEEEKHHLAEFGVGLRLVDEEQIEADEKGV